PQPDHFADRRDVAAETMEVLGLLTFDRPGLAGRDRVDEDQITVPEQGLRVVGESVGRRQQTSDVAHQHPPGTEHAQMQPEAPRAGSAVERERNRPGRRIGAVERVGDHEHLGLGRGALELVLGVLLGPQHDPAGGRRVPQLAAVDIDRVRGGYQVVGWLACRAAWLAVRRGRLLLRFLLVSLAWHGRLLGDGGVQQANATAAALVTGSAAGPSGPRPGTRPTGRPPRDATERPPRTGPAARWPRSFRPRPRRSRRVRFRAGRRPGDGA